jgi:hypothetical protein
MIGMSGKEKSLFCKKMKSQDLPPLENSALIFKERLKCTKN